MQLHNLDDSPARAASFSSKIAPHELSARRQAESLPESGLTNHGVKTNASDTDTGQKVSLEQAVAELDKRIQPYNRRLAFRYDAELKETVIQVLNQETGEVIRQIPPEEVLKTRSKVASIMGLIVDKQI